MLGLNGLAEELDGPAVSAFRYAIAEIKENWMGDQKFIISSSSVLRKAR
jgi:capsid protein